MNPGDYAFEQRLCDATQSRSLDAAAIAAGRSGYDLMYAAGLAAFRYIAGRWPETRSMRVFCGAGNNAGDGYVLAALAKEQGWRVLLAHVKDPDALEGEAAEAVILARKAEVSMRPVDDACLRELLALPQEVLLVDALLGTGIQGRPRQNYAAVIDALNSCDLPVLALDIPSGLNADTGYVEAGCAVRATATISFIAHKRGLWTADGPDYVGEYTLATLDVDAGVHAQVNFADEVFSLEPSGCLCALRRPRSAHKFRQGQVAVMGGELGMGGAALLSAHASLCSGAGLVLLLTRTEHLGAAQSRLPELMTRALPSSWSDNEQGDEPALRAILQKSSVIVVGPGLGQNAWGCAALQAAIDAQKPLVLDADALNLLANGAVQLNAGSPVITPHPGEAARLLNISVAAVQADRFSAVRALQARYGGVTVLKGAGTLVCDGRQTLVCTRGGPALAIPGSGDVLAGLIGALIAQGLNSMQAASLGVFAHASAGDNLATSIGEIGLRASDLILAIRAFLNEKAFYVSC